MLDTSYSRLRWRRGKGSSHFSFICRLRGNDSSATPSCNRLDIRAFHHCVIWSWHGVRTCETAMKARPVNNCTIGYQPAGETLADIRRRTPTPANLFEIATRVLEYVRSLIAI